METKEKNILDSILEYEEQVPDANNNSEEIAAKIECIIIEIIEDAGCCCGNGSWLIGCMFMLAPVFCFISCAEWGNEACGCFNCGCPGFFENNCQTCSDIDAWSADCFCCNGCGLC